MEALPVFLKLRGEPVTLIGGGTVASRKALFLCRAGANLTVIAPEIDSGLQVLLDDHGGTWQARAYAPGDLGGQILVIAATPDNAVNRRVHAEARERNIPVNVVDTPELCTFTFPSIVDRNPLLVAIGTNGASPVLGRAVRRQLEAMLPARLGDVARFAGRLRGRVKAAIPDESTRRRFWEDLVEGAVAEMVMAGRTDEALAAVDALLAKDTAPVGEVFLIGAGPGDPDLMTFKALRLLQRADVILHDRLVPQAIIDLGRRDAQRIYVGKRRAEHALPQEEINQALVDYALQGKCVVRLKGGDPFVFGRGGEEITLLARHGIPFQIVPGITAANAAACYAGIPLTHRDYAQSVRFLTGHTRDGKLPHRWEEFQSPQETLVFYMGLVGLPIICKQLQTHGRDPGTPVALVEKASTAEQRVIRGTLSTMTAVVEREQPQPPTLIIIGDVVRLAADLAWCD